jgi:hypothetical protein
MGPFDDPLYSRCSTWKLSTSNVGAPWVSWFGFGPTAADGFGLGYSINGDNIPVHVSSFRDGDCATSAAMHAGICAALEELRQVCGGA